MKIVYPREQILSGISLISSICSGRSTKQIYQCSKIIASNDELQILGTDLEDCLTFFRFPPRHWKRIRTSNPLERCFREVKRRTRVIGRFPNEMAALSLVWSIIDQDAKKWRGIKMGPELLRLVETAVETLRNEPIVVRGFEELIAA